MKPTASLLLAHMREKPDFGNRPKKRRFYGLQPELVAGLVDQFFERRIPLFDHQPAGLDVLGLAGIRFSHRRVPDVRRDAKKLAEQMHGFADVPENKPRRRSSLV